MTIERIAIVGTGTDVGKTVLSLLIMQFLFRAGHAPLYIKPFQTGCSGPESPGTDAAFIYRHIPELAGSDPAGSVINCHETPKAPYFAARDMGLTIDVDATLAAIREKEHETMNGRTVSHLVVEAAGGLLVPVTPDMTVADFIARAEARPVIAAHAGLGTINHTLLSLQCLERMGINPAGVVFMETGPVPTPPDMVAENMEAVESLSGIRVAGVIPFMTDFRFPDPDPAVDRVIETVLKSRV